jgi:hypothetical protein
MKSRRVMFLAACIVAASIGEYGLGDQAAGREDVSLVDRCLEHLTAWKEGGLLEPIGAGVTLSYIEQNNNIHWLLVTNPRSPNGNCPGSKHLIVADLLISPLGQKQITAANSDCSDASGRLKPHQLMVGVFPVIGRSPTDPPGQDGTVSGEADKAWIVDAPRRQFVPIGNVSCRSFQ